MKYINGFKIILGLSIFFNMFLTYDLWAWTQGPVFQGRTVEVYRPDLAKEQGRCCVFSIAKFQPITAMILNQWDHYFDPPIPPPFDLELEDGSIPTVSVLKVQDETN